MICYERIKYVERWLILLIVFFWIENFVLDFGVEDGKNEVFS